LTILRLLFTILLEIFNKKNGNNLNWIKKMQ